MMKRMVLSLISRIIHTITNISSIHRNSPFCAKICEIPVKGCEFLCRSCGKQRGVGHKLSFCQGNIHPASVGEAISRPCGTTAQNGIGSGESVQILNISPFNQPLSSHKPAGRLIASPTGVSLKPAAAGFLLLPMMFIFVFHVR